MPEVPWIVFLARLAGLAPYRHSSQSGDYTACRVLEVASVLGLCTTCAFFSWRAFSNRLGFETGGAELLVMVLTTGQQGVLIVTLCWRQYPLLRGLLNSPALRSLPRRPYYLLPYLVAGSYFAGLGYALLDRTIDTIRHCESCSRWMMALWGSCFVYISLAGSLNAGLFAYLLCCIADLVEEGNAELQRMATEEVGADGPQRVDVAVLRRRYQEAGGLAQRVCLCFGVQILGDLFQDLWWVVRETFFLLREVHSFHDVWLGGIDTAKSIVSKAALILVANQLTSKAHKTLFLIHALRNAPRSLDSQERQELEEFSRQAYQQPVVVSICGVIDLNSRLFFQAVGVAVTYVIILLQFQSPMK